MFRRIFGLLERHSDWRAAKATYGPEPRRTPTEVTVTERVEAVLAQYVVGLLGDVTSVAGARSMSREEQAASFRKLLPTTMADVNSYLKEHNLTPRYAYYERPEGKPPGIYIAQCGELWTLYELERTHHVAVVSGTRVDVATEAVRLGFPGIDQYLVESNTSAA